jgi:hypothetical protein
MYIKQVIEPIIRAAGNFSLIKTETTNNKVPRALKPMRFIGHVKKYLLLKKRSFP